MKKSLLALAVAAALPVVAQAQTNVTLYGIVDAGVGIANPGAGGSSNVRVEPGVVSGNRWGLRGSEDLGGGMSANFALENGFTIDTGGAAQGGLLFGRQAWVGVKTGGLEVRMGRQYSPGFYTLATYDTMGLGYWGNTAQIAANVRVDNSVELSGGGGGLTARLMLGTGAENLVSASKKSGRFAGLGLNYAAGPLGVGFAYENYNSTTGTFPSNKVWNLGASYNLGAATLFAGYSNQDPDGNNNTVKAAWLGANVKAGAGNVLVQLMQIDPAGAAKSNTLALAYSHGLSKRTSAYASFGMVRNNSAANTPLWSASANIAPVANGGDPKAFTVGVRHTF